MSKIKKAFFCKQCGYESAKWTGKCPACHEWNSFTEEIIHKEQLGSKESWKENSTNNKSVVLHEVVAEEKQRIITKDEELNRVLGGGIVLGSLVLVAGEPGIGKSTLLLQDALLVHH
jgi:DNA repair protein RadA/Sms